MANQPKASPGQAAAINGIEELIGTEVGRGSSILKEHTHGGLLSAATSLALQPGRSRHAVIITGFYIPGASPPAAETDGPVGAVQMTVALSHLGWKVDLLTDQYCKPAISELAKLAGLDVDILACPSSTGTKKHKTASWISKTIRDFNYKDDAVTHMIAIERVGPNHRGEYCNMLGEDITPFTAPLDKIFAAGSWLRIGIGDGGNEIGMGCLPAPIVKSTVRYGDKIRCVTKADYLIVGGTSNWGAAGLVAAMAILDSRLKSLATTILDPHWSIELLDVMQTKGLLVDGVTRALAATVDGLENTAYYGVLKEIKARYVNLDR